MSETRFITRCRQRSAATSESRKRHEAEKRPATESRSFVPQDSGNCGYRVPITCGYRDAENLVELAKVAKRFHLAPVQTEDEPVFRGEDLQKPFAARRKTEGCRRQRLPPF